MRPSWNWISDDSPAHKAIHKGLDRVRGQREQGRRSRQRAEVPTVSLVGYTNAGKSTLFNALTDAQTYAADQLFATLDSTLRRIELPNLGPAIVADTVGFISHLPHGLVEAFRATLEETASATLLLHVIDGANEAQGELRMEVESVLKEIDADQVPRLEVINKIDSVPDDEPRLLRNEAGLPVRVWVSAKTGVGLDLLLTAMTELLSGGLVSQRLSCKRNRQNCEATCIRVNLSPLSKRMKPVPAFWICDCQKLNCTGFWLRKTFSWGNRSLRAAARATAASGAGGQCPLSAQQLARHCKMLC